MNLSAASVFSDGLCTGEKLPEKIKNGAEVVPLSALLSRVEGFRTLTVSLGSNRIRAMRYIGNEELFYPVNEGAESWSGIVTLPDGGEYHVYDAWNDRDMAWNGEEVTIYPSHSLILIKGAAKETYTPPKFGERRVISGFTESVCRSIDYPNFTNVRKIEKPQSYVMQNKKFSGFIRYETSFTGKAQALEITDAYEGVEVFVNGQSVGIQVVPPFRYDLRGLTTEGENTLTVEVATTLERERGGAKNAAPTGITGEVALYF